MSAEFDQVRASAVQIAHVELAKVIRETRLENRGPIVDIYLRVAGLGPSALADTSADGADARRWCGMFVYYCYLKAATLLGRRLPFQQIDPQNPAGSQLWSGQRLVRWSRHNSTSILRANSPVQSGDIFSVPIGHIGLAIGPSDAAGNFPTIEGNQGDLEHTNTGIARRTMNRTRCQIIVRI